MEEQGPGLHADQAPQPDAGERSPLHDLNPALELIPN